MSRQLWQPDPEEQRAACEILLASSIPSETRRVVRALEQSLPRHVEAQPDLRRQAA